MQPSTARAIGHLTLLGATQISGLGLQIERLERKTAGLLAYLALEGPAARSRLAGLLWPNSVESTARNNLAQVLRRLKQAAGGLELIVGGDTLGLQGLECDGAALEVAHFAGHHEQVVQATATLLEGYEYDDCPEFDDWLLAQRERLAELARKSRAALSEAEEAKANYHEALHHAEVLLTLEPLSEAVHRRVMRLLYLQGDRAAALAAYHRCQAILKKELGLEPLPETQTLARMIESGGGIAAEPTLKPKTIPLSVLRPPLLVGREREWAALEAAWQTGQGIVVAGEPGVGKTRLMLDFVAVKGDYEVLEGRPGDATIAYAAYARSFRRVLGRHPELVLEDWVRQELSRLMPELWDKTPPAIQSESEKLRFFEAATWILGQLQQRGLKAICADDLQFMDSASYELAQYILTRLADLDLRFVSAYRVGELSPELEAGIRQSVEAGAVFELRLEPLDTQAVTHLLESLRTEEGLEGLGQSLSRYTGGNPMFVLETLKNLYETGQLAQGLPERLPLAGKIRPLIQRRLERLSAEASRLAYTAAIAGPDFSPELAALVLGKHPLELAEAFSELEATQVLKGNAFAHDLIYEGTLSSIPGSITSYLHRRVAEYLEPISTDPARIAAHWLSGGDDLRAAPFLQQATERAFAAFRRDEALGYANRAIEIYRASAQTDAEFDLLYQVTSTYRETNQLERFEQAVERLLHLAETPRQKAQACLRATEAASSKVQVEDNERYAREGLQWAAQAQDETLTNELEAYLAEALWAKGQLQEGLELYDRVIDWANAHNRPDLAFAHRFSHGAILMVMGRYVEAIEEYSELAEQSIQLGDSLSQIMALRNRAVAQAGLGLARASIASLLEVLQTIQTKFPDSSEMQLMLHLSHISLGSNYIELSHYAKVIEHLEGVVVREPSKNSSWYAQRYLARAYCEMGQYPLAEDVFAQALEHLLVPARWRCATLFDAALLQIYRGQPHQVFLSEALQLAQESSQPGLQIRGLMIQSLLEQNPSWAQQATEIARAQGMFGVQIGTLSRLAWAMLLHNRPQEALAASQEAQDLLQTYDPVDFYLGEVLWVHYQALEANGDARALSHLEQTLEWLTEIAKTQVLPAYREGFLTHNPTNIAILEAAKAAGLSTP